jgi:hypothetical protein
MIDKVNVKCTLNAHYVAIYQDCKFIHSRMHEDNALFLLHNAMSTFFSFFCLLLYMMRVYVCTCISMCVCARACVYVYMYVCISMCVYIYVYIYIYTYIRTYMHVRARTHMHIYKILSGLQINFPIEQECTCSITMRQNSQMR